MFNIYKLTTCSLALGLVLSGCATQTAYYREMNSLVSAGKYDNASALAENSKNKEYGDKNALLYLLDRGLLLHLAGKYQESSETFEQAKALSESLFTKSITAEASTFLISDNMRPYYGEDYERALLHVFSALNYVMLDNEGEALVEARQVDSFLTTLETNYGRKNTYKEDAFARYLMGMLYENQGEVNDAYISYYRALEGYKVYGADYGTKVPEELVSDALRLARKLGNTDDIVQIKKDWPDIIAREPEQKNFDKNLGEAVLVCYLGAAPYKIDNFFEISFGRAWLYVESADVSEDEEEKFDQAGAIARSIISEEQIRMAFPKYADSKYRAGSVKAELTADSTGYGFSGSGSLAEDIGSIAKKNLEDKNARTNVKTIVRATIKFVLAHEIASKVQDRSNNEVLGWLTKKILSAASAATELADKRSWRLLPDKIYVVRVKAPAGEYRLKMNVLDDWGAGIETREFENVVIKPGKKTFVIARTTQ